MKGHNYGHMSRKPKVSMAHSGMTKGGRKDRSGPLSFAKGKNRRDSGRDFHLNTP